MFFWVAILLGSQAEAATRYWVGTWGDEGWHNANNWYNSSAPGAGDNVYIGRESLKYGRAILTQAASIVNLYVGRDAADCMLTIDGGDLYASSSVMVGSLRRCSFGKILHRSGSVDVNQLWLGSSEATGEYKLLSGSLKVRGMGYFGSSEGTGFVDQRGGTAALNHLALGYTGKATYELSGGSLTVQGNHFIGHTVGDSTCGKFI